MEILEALAPLLGVLLGFLAAILSEPLRQRLFKPRLRVEFTGPPDCVASTPEMVNRQEVEARYVRLKISNTSWITAKDSRVHLVDLEKKGEDGEFHRTDYSDSIQLAWSCQVPGEEYRAIEIRKDVPQYVDVLATRNTEKTITPRIMVMPFRYQKLFMQTGVFRFHMLVTAARADPKHIMIVLDWKGVWDDLVVHSES